MNRFYLDVKTGPDLSGAEEQARKVATTSTTITIMSILSYFVSFTLDIQLSLVISFPRLPTKAMIGHVGATRGGSFWRV